MKKYTFLLSAILMSLTMLAQVLDSPTGGPMGINYQTVIRDGDGNILPNTELSLQMTVRSGAPDGEAVYIETHNATTNTYGLVNLVIGNGTPQNGTFEDINWGDGDKYLETAVDLSGGSDFTILGVTQFLSVPYSKMADMAHGVQSMTIEERDALQNPPVGMAIYNTTTNCLNYFNGTSWFETCGDCTPMPSQAIAGPNQYFDDETLATNLAANTPEFGTGTWSVVSGIGGTFDNINDPRTLFTGQVCEIYVLKWTIDNPCGSKSDSVNIQFDIEPTAADAGEDQLFLDNTTTITLAANTPEIGEGIWSIQSGQGGTFDDPANPISGFIGQQCQTYILRWTISTPCNTTFDEVSIEFSNAPTVANAGPDQWNALGTSTTLEGNAPENGLGFWSIVSGSGGIIQFPTNPNSVFIGQQDVYYELKWTISTECSSSPDTVNVLFPGIVCGQTYTDIRDGQQYETTQIGNQCWMAENLNVGTRIDGIAEQTNNSTIEKYCYSNSDAQCDIYGGLYLWNEMMQYIIAEGVQGICPEGWHLPSDAEWIVLTTYLGGEYIAGGKMKETGTLHWISPNTGATNSSGFTGLPGSYRGTSGLFGSLGVGGYFWSSTEYSELNAWVRSLHSSNATVNNYNATKTYGYSVRCLRD